MAKKRDQMNYKTNDRCLVCEQPVTTEYLDLSDQPLANSYHKGEILDKYPLRMRVCTNCWHSQLSVSVEPSKMFEHYLYISDTSKTLTDYFEWVTNYILEKCQPKNVLEIACNSGLLLEMFQNKGIQSYGVDPAKNIRELSEKRNLNVFVDYWNKEFSEKLKDQVGKLDLILAFHVLPHVQDPNDFIDSCVNVLSDDGTIFIQTSQCDMLLNNEFDVIYHEHSSYFTGKSIRELAHRHGLYVSSIVKTDIHSKSFLFSLQKNPCQEPQLDDLIAFETQNNIYTLDKYHTFSNTASEIKDKLLIGLQKLRDDGYHIIGYGAAAKGNTLLNYINFRLDYIIDDSYMKWGYRTPGQDIEIHNIDLLNKVNFEKIVFVPLAWNFYTEIKQRINAVRDTTNDVFVRYFPDYIEEK
jgi:2-polyprenyl-3-methyl-5-hydroxy-6-metoxy-1,4-benzoquinol methylase